VKIALLIGVTEYGEGIPALSAPIKNVEAMERVLCQPERGGFDKVQTLINPEIATLQCEIKQFFDNAQKEDLLLLFYSGHSMMDANHHLYLTTHLTSQTFFQATSISAQFIQQQSCRSLAKQQVIILDCCYSGTFEEGWQSKNRELNLKQQFGLNELGSEGRAVLTSSSVTQALFQSNGADLSVYTQYLVELWDRQRVMHCAGYDAPISILGDPDDEPEELILESIGTSLEQICRGDIHPIAELWNDIDV
jgi:uncharacterized caspase-like protein